MKKYLIAFFYLLMIVSIARAQKPSEDYTIEGNIKGLKDGWIFSVSESQIPDSAWSKNGHFIFKGTLKYPTQAYILDVNTHQTLEIFLDKGATVKISGTAERFESCDVKGGPTQSDFNLYLQSIKGIKNKISLFDVQSDFIKAHPKSYLTIYLLNSMKKSATSGQLMTLLNLTDKSIRNSSSGDKIRKMIETKIKTDIGQLALDFSQPDTLGHQVKLSDFKGHYVLLDFWASWCAPCRAENPHVLRAYQAFKNHGFTVLSISLDVNRKSWIKAVCEDKLPWIQVSDLKQKNLAAELYNVQGIPANYLIDPNGTIIAKDLRGEALQNTLSKVMSINKP